MAIGLENAGFSDALVILGAAGLVIPAFARFRVSPVIGFILVGMLVGPHGLGSLIGSQPWLYYLTISEPESIEPFAEFGIVLLLFSIGLELSFKRLWALRRPVFVTGAAELFGSALLIGTLPRSRDVTDGVVSYDAVLVRADSTGTPTDTLGRVFGGFAVGFGVA